MADVELHLDADHADYLAGAIETRLESGPLAPDEQAVLRGIREVIHTQMSPERLP